MRFRVGLCLALAFSLSTIAIPALANPGDPTVSTLDSIYSTGTSTSLVGNIEDAPIEDVISRGFEFGLSDSYGTTLSQTNTSNPALIRTLTAQDSAEGKFNGPTNIEIDTLGNIYVADVSARIQKFNSNYDFITQWNWYSPSQVIPQERAPLATDTNNNVYVVNIINQTVQKYDTNGNLLGNFISGGVSDIDIDQNNNIYLVKDSKVQVYDLNAQLLKEWNLSFQLYGGNSITVDATGNVYVSDKDSQTIEKFNSEGASLLTFSTHGDPANCTGSQSQPLGIYAASNGSIYVTNTYCELVQRFDTNGNYIASIGSSTYSDLPGLFDTPHDIIEDLNGNLLVADTENDRIQKLSNVGSYISHFGSYGSNIIRPTDTAVDSKGYSYVIDFGNSRVNKYDRQGNVVLTWGTQSFRTPLDDYEFWMINGIEIDDQDNIYINCDSNTIRKYDSSGNFLSKFQFQGYGQQFIVDQDKNIWISSDYDNTVRKYSQLGTLLLSFGGTGTGDGQFNTPRAMATDPNGNLFVVDGGNQRIQKFANDGTYLSKFGSSGNGPGQFHTPGSIAINSNGTIFVADGLYSRIHIFDSDTNFLRSITDIDSTDPISIYGWFSLSFDATNTLYISDHSYGRVLVVSPFISGDFSIDANNLACETLYHYRAFATNNTTTAYGQDRTFLTGECSTLPGVQTQQASNIGEDYATLSGELIKIGGDIAALVGFEYGLTQSYGSQINSLTSNTGTFTFEITDLVCNSTYHYRATATNHTGSSTGDDNTFSTGACTGTPVVQTWQNQSQSNNSQLLMALVSDSGTSNITEAGFLYGPTNQYGLVAISSDFSPSGSGQFTVTLTSLACGTEYHYSAYATNSKGSSFGSDQSFTTQACPVPETDFSLDVGFDNSREVNSGDAVTYSFTITNVGPNDSIFTGEIYIFLPLEFTFTSSTNANVGCSDFGPASTIDPGGYMALHFGQHHLVACSPTSQNLAFENGSTINFDILGTANSDFIDRLTVLQAIYLTSSGETTDSQIINDAIGNNVDFTTLDINNNTKATYIRPPAATTTTTATTPTTAPSTVSPTTTMPNSTPVTTRKPVAKTLTKHSKITGQSESKTTNTTPTSNSIIEMIMSKKTHSPKPAIASGGVENEKINDLENKDRTKSLVLGRFSVTGSNIFDIIIIASLLLAFGIFIYLMVWKRKREEEEE